MVAQNKPQLLWEITSRGEEETVELGRRLGRACRGGEVILLEGSLGAGKTCLAGGIAAGLGIDQPAVSPTFVIMRSYTGARGLTLHHMDFYRLGGDHDLETIGLEDCFSEDSVILAEWPSRCPHAFEDFSLLLEIEVLDENGRRLRAYAGGLPAPEPLAEG
jgi:tRNA threonylcarbamoyladenosine biosynthesis protein TsaE